METIEKCPMNSVSVSKKEQWNERRQSESAMQWIIRDTNSVHRQLPSTLHSASSRAIRQDHISA
jgi:hypothetical protein